MRSLLKGQLSFMGKYFEVIAVSSPDENFEDMLKEQQCRGIAVKMSRKITPIQDLISLFRLIVLFIKEKPDIVHTHTPKAGTLGMIAAWLCRVPCRIHTVAGLPLLVAAGKKRKLLDVVEKITYRCATKVYPNSFVQKDMIERLKFTKTSKLKVLANGSSNGINTQHFNPSHFTKNEDRVFRFVFIGRMVGDKGINELAQAFTRLNAIYPETELVLVGNFEEKLDPLKSETKEILDNHKAINFVGYQSDVRPFLAMSDAFVFPSYREGFPNVVMQAGAMGLPQIVTNINGCNEIIVEGENGVIIPSKDEEALYAAMQRFVTSPDEVSKMAINARDMITSRYEQAIVWDAILSEYKLLLGQ
ncbi:MAG: glycosyltransferase family 4 protein [Rikenellaceae bacterium]